MDEQLKNLLTRPVRQVVSFAPLGAVVKKYLPRFKDAGKEDIPETLTFGDLLSDGTLTQDDFAGMMREIGEAFARFQAISEAEAREFDPDVDLTDDHYLWGSPENKEKCVQSIEKRYAGRTGEIVFYGPSNITLWYSLEKDMLPYAAQNHGMGGCTDVDLMHYADRLLYPFAPKVVFFQTGSNDLADGITPEQILRNKEKMYGEFLEKLPDTELVVMSGLPLPGRQEFWPDTVKTNEYLRAMCDAHERLHFMDATDVMLAETGEEEFRAPDGRFFRPEFFRMDRIHLNVKGHEAWTGLMKEMLESLL